jgi:hypothetical protein
MIPMPPPTHEQTMEAIVACGVPAVNIHISYEDDLQSDVVSISNLGGSDEARFRCLRQAVHPSYVLEIEDEDQRIAFHSFSEREDRTRWRAEAIEWLRQYGMMDRVPQYDPVRGVEEFARELEAACSIPEGTALETVGSFAVAFRRDFLARGFGGHTHVDQTCLSRMFSASNAADHDVHLVVIGQAAADHESP